MSDEQHPLEQVRITLERERDRVLREAGADHLAADLFTVLGRVETVITRAEDVAATRRAKGRDIRPDNKRALTELTASLTQLHALAQAGATR